MKIFSKVVFFRPVEYFEFQNIIPSIKINTLNTITYSASNHGDERFNAVLIFGRFIFRKLFMMQIKFEIFKYV